MKSRMSTTSIVQKGQYLADVRSQTFRPRNDLDMLFVAVDVERRAIMTAWLVPSGVFGEMVSEPNGKGKYRFAASLKPDSKDRWTPYRLTAAELSQRILARLSELEKAG
ncbi:hypothetical protein ACR6C2_15040 [Streptomyces sp. INA 01156]